MSTENIRTENLKKERISFQNPLHTMSSTDTDIDITFLCAISSIYKNSICNHLFNTSFSL